MNVDRLLLPRFVSRAGRLRVWADTLRQTQARTPSSVGVKGAWTGPHCCFFSPWGPTWGFGGVGGQKLQSTHSKSRHISQVGLENLCLLHVSYTFNRKQSRSIKSRKQNHSFLAGCKEKKSLRWLQDGKEVIFY